MIKKILAALSLMLVMILIASACAPAPAPTPAPTPTVNTTPTPAPTEEAILPEITTAPDINNPPEEEEVLPENTPAPSGDFPEIEKAINDKYELPAMLIMPDEMVEQYYAIDGLYAKKMILMPLMNVKSDEIAVFEAKDALSAKEIYNAIDKRQKALEEQWKQYLPDQYELVKNSYRETINDKYVIYVIGEKAKDIAATIKENLK